MSNASSVSAPVFTGAEYSMPLTGVAERTAEAVEPIDGQVRSATRELETTSQRSQALQSDQVLLRAVQVAVDELGGKSNSAHTLSKLQVKTVDGRTGTADELLREAGLLEVVDPTGDGKVSSQTLTGLLEQLGAERENINSGNQLRMIQLQELMHQRNLLLQLATQELSARDQIERRIVENIR